MLGPARWNNDWYFRKEHRIEAIRLENNRVEPLLRFIPDWDEEYFLGGTPQIREKNFGHPHHKTARRPSRGKCQLARTHKPGRPAKVKDGWLPPSLVRWHRRGFRVLALIIAASNYTSNNKLRLVKVCLLLRIYSSVNNTLKFVIIFAFYLLFVLSLESYV